MSPPGTRQVLPGVEWSCNVRDVFVRHGQLADSVPASRHCGYYAVMSRSAEVKWSRAIVGSVLMGAVLAGCAAYPAPAAREVEPASAATVTDIVTCEAFGDVSTIIANADIALAEGRMEVQERDGWYRLATRVLSRIPTSGSGAVHDAIEELKNAAPAIKLGAIADPGFRSIEWDQGKRSLTEACNIEGVDMALEAFTGG